MAIVTNFCGFSVQNVLRAARNERFGTQNGRRNVALEVFEAKTTGAPALRTFREQKWALRARNGHFYFPEMAAELSQLQGVLHRSANLVLLRTQLQALMVVAMIGTTHPSFGGASLFDQKRSVTHLEAHFFRQLVGCHFYQHGMFALRQMSRPVG